MFKLYKLVSKARQNNRLLLGLFSGLCIFIALIYGISYNLKREYQISQWVLLAQEEIYQIEKTISLIKDYETGSRGFLLTNKEAYETPLNEASKEMDDVLRRLAQMTKGDKVQQRNLDSLIYHLDKKAAFSTNIIKIKRAQGQEQAMKVFHTGVGKVYMDAIRRVANTMHLHAKQELARRKIESANAVKAANRILLVGIIFFTVFLIYAIWKSWQQERNRKLADEHLHIEKAFSEALLTASPDGMVGFNKKGEIILYNKRSEDLFGYNLQEIVGTPVINLLPEEARDAHLTQREKFFTRSTTSALNEDSIEITAVRKNGATFPADVRLNLVNSYKGEILIASIRDISERKLAETRLKESEKNLQAILSSSQEAIYLLDLNCKLVLLNEHSRQLINLTHHVSCKPGDDFVKLFTPEVCQQHKAIFEQVLTGNKLEVEQVFQLPNGEAFYLATYFPVKDKADEIIGICFAAKNITERKKSEKALKIATAEKEEYQYRFKAILDYSPQAILIKDVAGNEIFSNKAFQQLFDIEQEQNYDQQLHAILDNSTVLNQFKSSYTEADLKEQVSKVWTQPVVLPNGQKQEMEIMKFPLYDRQKQLFGICTICKDITEQINHEQQLVAARENAEQAERLQEQFLANMSHELRTPMNGIIGMVNLLLTSSSLQQDQKGRLQIIKHSSDTLLNLINDILDLSKIKAGMFTFEKVNFDFTESIAGTALLFKEKAREKGIKLAVSADPFIPRYLSGDPHRLNQILNNLLSNAIKFTERGFVKLEASLLQETEEQAMIEFTVSDSGIGIESDRLNYIFENFTQESTDISSKYGGTGLGLAITKRLIEMQGGEITVASIKGEGTNFTFTIPYTVVTKAGVITHSYTLPNSGSGKKDFSGKQALIVEDNEINQAVLASTLKQHKVEFQIANNGQEAVELLEAGQRFDIIFMDLRMPVMNGFQATAYIRQKLELNTPIVVLTASVLRNERERCMEIGASAYMAKPFSIPDLVSTLEQFILGNGANNTPITIAPEAIFSTESKAFDISRLIELENPEYIRRVYSLFTEKMPVYLEELKTHLPTDNRTEFLERTHKLKGSLSAIQIEALYQQILTMESKTDEIEHLNEFDPLLADCIDLYETMLPALQDAIESTIAELEAKL